MVYQVYPRSFQDSDGDGEGDLAGVAARLDHVAALGADAIWLSPFFPSPMADGGYDVTDHTGVDPRFGTLADVDALVAEAHARGLRVLLDVVPCHTSIEHPWFRDDPRRYVWSDRDGPANNWVAAFGGPAWSPDPAGRGWYLHSFYPEQPDLDWRRDDVRREMGEMLRGWRARGVDGFRLDAIDRLLKDPELRDEPPSRDGGFLEEPPEAAALDHTRSRDAPDIGEALAVLRDGAGDDAYLVGEVYLPSARLRPYLAHVDVAFCFELLQADWSAHAVRAALEGALAPDGPAGRVAWVLSNHDFPRLPERVGRRNVRAAAMLLLTLPGPAFVYQGDEIGMGDGPGGSPPRDRAGRDRHRHPMCWDAAAPHGGFTTGEPWLPAIAVEGGGVAQQAEDPRSTLTYYRDLIRLRRELRSGIELLDADEDVLAYRRGDRHVVALNLGDRSGRTPASGEVLCATRGELVGARGRSPTLAPGDGVVLAHG